MDSAKIQIKIGAIEFSGEGKEEWVAKQLDKILEKASSLAKLSLDVNSNAKGTGLENRTPMGEDSEISKKPLATFLKEKSATTNQVKKFLATAVWLESKGQKRLSTRDITKALSDANQSKLTNSSDTLNSNVGKGHCEKDGKQFFVTEDGKNTL
jgi:hypothetical protein